MMMRCIAIDDEPLALELLADNISKLPYLNLVAQCNNALEAIKVLQEQQVDLIFLDIQMPGLTGIQFLQSLSAKPMCIFITAYEKYAMTGYDLDVVDYLVKPVPLERFIKACNKAHELFLLKKSQSPGNAGKAQHIFLNVDYKLLKVVFDDIMWIEGLKDYIRIHIKSSSRPVITRMSMKAIEEQLPPGDFLRIHKSYIISSKFVTAVMKNSLYIGDIELPVSENYKEALTTFTGRNF